MAGTVNTFDWAAIIAAHPGWASLMDKQIVALVIEGKADADEAARFVFARKMRKYS